MISEPGEVAASVLDAGAERPGARATPRLPAMRTRTLVALVLFVVAGLPLVVGVLLQQRAEAARLAQERDRMLSVAAKDIIEELRNVIEGALEVARADGGLPGLADLLAAERPDEAQRVLVNRYLTTIASRDPVNITSVALLDLQGRNRADLAGSQAGSDESTQPYFTEVLRRGTPQLHGPLLRPGEQRPGLIVAAPVRDTPNPPVGVLRIRFEAARVAQTVDGNLRLRPQLGAVVRDGEGRIFARSGQALVDGVFSAVLPLGTPFDLVGDDGVALGRAVAIAVPRTGWQLVVFEPESRHAYLAEARRWHGYAFIALLCVVLGAAAWLVGHLLARPLMQLTATVEAIAAGDLERRIAPRGTAELHHLGSAVNAMNDRLGENLRALRGLADALEQRVEERTAELASSHQQLSLAMEQVVQNEKLASLGSLVAGIAHELNTPLGNALTTATSLRDHMRRFRADVESGQLRRSALNRMMDEAEEAGSMVERNLHRAAQLISHFKQVAVDQSSARRRRFDLRETVDEVLTTLQPRLRRLPYRLQVDGPPGIEMDSFPGALEQVITNLVCNSLDHAFGGREQGAIQIVLERRGDRAHLRYRDDGNGIPRELQKRVFDPFFTTRLGSGGSGLGLYLVYSLVTGSLGGQLTLHSEPGQGTCFELDLPLRVASPGGED